MIELDIKIRASNDESLKKLIGIMTESLITCNSQGETDVQLSAGIDKDNIIYVTRKEVSKWTKKM